MPNMTPATYGNFSLTAMQHSVTLADAKAGYLLAGSLAFLLFLSKEAFTPLTASSLTAFFCALALAATVVSSAMTFRPRFGSAPEGSLAFWKSKVFEGSEADVISAASNVSLTDNADRLVASHLFALAIVCRRKYATLRIAFYAALIAMTLFVGWRFHVVIETNVTERPDPILQQTKSQSCPTSRSNVTAGGMEMTASATAC